MAWKDRLLRASFRGVQFGIDSHETQAAGRRAAIHEYPTQDRPLAEDLGRRTKRYEISGWIVGEDYDRTRDRLIRVCDQAGPGELVHPYLGTVQVLCLELDVSERTSEGRMCRITLPVCGCGYESIPDRSGEPHGAGVEAGGNGTFPGPQRSRPEAPASRRGLS